MTDHSSQTFSSHTRRSRVVLGSSIMLALIGFSWLAFGISGVGFHYTIPLNGWWWYLFAFDFFDLFFLIPTIFIGVFSIAAAWGCWLQRPWAIYAQIIALLVQIQLILFITIGIEDLNIFKPILIISFGVSVIIFVLTASGRNRKPLILASIVALSLTIISSVYQQTGPFTGSFGNTCPGGACIDSLLGAGFPLPYIVDSTATSVWWQLGEEDEFLPIVFGLDVCFYIVLVYGGIRLWQHYRQRKRTSEDA